MKAIIISLIAVVCIGVNAGQTKEQKLNKQIAILESKNFALKNENKKLKAELQKKDKAINALAMRIAGQPVKSKATTSSNRYDPYEAQHKAAKLAAEQKKKQRARQLAIIDQKIKYYEKQKQNLEKEYKIALQKARSAKYTMGKRKRDEAIREANENKENIKNKMSNIDGNIELKISV